MKKINALFIFGAILHFWSTVALGCQREINDPSKSNKQLAYTLMSEFLILSGMEDWNNYDTLTCDERKLITLSPKKRNIIPEKYHLTNFYQENDYMGKKLSEPKCWWLFVPLSLANDFIKLRHDLHDKMRDLNFTHFSYDQDNLSFLDKEMEKFLKPHLDGWIYEKSFSRKMKIYGEEFFLNFSFLYHPQLNKVIFLGLSDNKPHWILINYNKDNYSIEDKEGNENIRSHN